MKVEPETFESGKQEPKETAREKVSVEEIDKRNSEVKKVHQG